MRTDETSFGMTTELIPMVNLIPSDRVDSSVNWQLVCADQEEGTKIKFYDRVKLKHSMSGKFVELRQESIYTEANCGRGCVLAGEVELHANENAEEDDATFELRPGMSFKEAE